MSARGKKRDAGKCPNVLAWNASWPDNPRSAARRAAQDLVIKNFNQPWGPFFQQYKKIVINIIIFTKPTNHEIMISQPWGSILRHNLLHLFASSLLSSGEECWWFGSWLVCFALLSFLFAFHRLLFIHFFGKRWIISSTTSLWSCLWTCTCVIVVCLMLYLFL